MKILLIIPTFLPIIGGAELAVFNIARQLKKNGVQADVLTFNIVEERWKTKLKTEIVYIDGIKVIRLGGFNLLFFINNIKFKSMLMYLIGIQIIPSFKIFKIINDYEIIHYNDEVNLSIPAILSLKRTKNTVFHLRTFDQLFRFFKRNAFLSYILGKTSDNFIIETERYLNMLTEINISEKQFIRWKKGVDTEAFRKYIGNDKLKRSTLFTILFVGRLDDSKKGLLNVIKAVSLIDIKLKLIVITPQYLKNEYSVNIMDSINEINALDGKEIEMLVNIEQSKLPYYYNQADVFVFTPEQDSMPNVILEASSCELPIISTKVGGIPSIITSDFNGILIEPNNPEILKEKLLALNMDSNLRKTLGKNARLNILENFDYDKSIKSLMNIYQNLITESKNLI